MSSTVTQGGAGGGGTTSSPQPATLADTVDVKAKDRTYAVKVSVKNASGYTWRQTVGFTVSGGEVTEVVPADDLVATGVPVMLRCDSAMGKVTGTGVYALGKVGTKKVSISATALSGYVFAGWYEDPGFAAPTASAQCLQRANINENEGERHHRDGSFPLEDSASGNMV